MRRKIKILFLAADPTNVFYRPFLGKELRGIQDAIHSSHYRNSFELVPRWAVRPQDLIQSLIRYSPDIVHITGHGNRRGIILENEHGRRKTVGSTRLLEIFKSCEKSIKLIFLNMCYSKFRARALSQVADFIIGMDRLVCDEHAIAFAAHFYEAIASGGSVQQAFDVAKLSVILPGKQILGDYNLFARNGTITSKSILLSDKRHCDIKVYED
jgi:hypothetical protein